ncbi:hypothetical protein ANANG_G00282670 [Anguilla anguilla]|uniref:Deoxyribonuclease-2-alpha n=1 Tax=Anguilla anguilla TaxID=7936 RepID=A0A9D3RKQ7_ANGAN|nr:hypothetical protein ANANG_G00282670 [Anguilla anguilla]
MEVMSRVVLTVSLLCWGICSSEAKVTCKDKNGGEVDWYILYKVPKLNNKALSGLEYFYIDSAKNEWPDPINNPKGVLAHTLQPLLAHKTETPDFGFISYNDQPAGCTADQVFGHSKGVVMMDKTTGVWLLHSTPHFPYDRKQGKLWPESGAQHAQTFICVTFTYSQFDQIGKHLQYIRAFPFDHYIPDGFHPVLKSVVKREDLKPALSPFLDQDLISLGRQKFKSFAKYISGSNNARDLYFHIAKDLKSNLFARTWRGSKENEESDCSDEGSIVYTIDFVEMTLNVDRKRVKMAAERQWRKRLTGLLL